MKFKIGDIVVLTDSAEEYYHKIYGDSFFSKYGDFGQKYEVLLIKNSLPPKRGWNDMMVELRNIKTRIEFEIHMTWIDDIKYHRHRQISQII